MNTTEVLRETLFSWVYTLFRVSGDDELMYRMTLIALIYTVVVGFASFLKPAPYGRHSREPSNFTISATTGWIIQEAPAFIVSLALIILTPCSKLRESNGNKIALFLFMIHYFHRAFIYPFRIRNSKHAALSTCIMAFIFCFYNGLFQGMHIINIQLIESSALTILGTVIFIIGMAINIYYDGILIGLRKNSLEKSEGEIEYKIPRGGLFDLISGANYFGEMLEWWGFFIVTKGIPQLTFAVFSNVFLGLRALHHHEWYKNRFGKAYPVERKVIVPYVL